MCLKGNASCPVSCTELSKTRYTMKIMLQMNTTSHPGQTHSAHSDAVVILTSFLFHRGLLHSYAQIHVQRERETAREGGRGRESGQREVSLPPDNWLAVY
jgi:hypothetical protein